MRASAPLVIALGLLMLGRSERALAQVPALPPAASASAPAAPVDSVKERLIRDMLAQTHAVDIMFQTMEAALPVQRAANPQVPAAFWDRFIAAVHDHRGDLEMLVIRIYDRHFTTDELRQALAFYGTPVGKKLLAEQPAIVQEAQAAGREWGQQLGMEIGQKMAAEAQQAP